MKNLFLIRLSTSGSVKRLLGLMLFLGLLSPVLYAEDYYVNCGAASSANADGSEAHPWNTLDPLRAITFAGGDHIYFARGTTCLIATLFNPHGSGSATAGPIIVDAYPPAGSTATALPIISTVGSTANAVFKLENQQYWEVNDLDLEGGVQFGLYVANTTTAWLTHLHFSGLVVEGATWVMKKRVDSGEVFIKSSATGGTLNDVLVSHVQAGGANTTVSEGIFVQAGVGYQTTTNPTGGTNVVVENSVAHDVYGDGILVVGAYGALLQNNVVYNSGMCPSSCGSSTPGGLWEWNCLSCTVQDNESYANQTYGTGDGGDYDLDASNSNNIIQDNYGHDAGGYCVMLFSSNGNVNANDIIRNNTCTHNEQKSKAYNEGEIYVDSTTGSSIDGGQIYGNTLYWSPNPAQSSRFAILTIHGIYSGADTTIENNTVYAETNPNMVWTTTRTSSPTLILDDNQYVLTETGATPAWATGEVDTVPANPVPLNFYSNLDNSPSDPQSFNGNTGQDVNSTFQGPS
jgi:hypothetical protein